MKLPIPKDETSPSPCCAHLRSKSFFYSGEERPGLIVKSNTTSHWCLKTSDAHGPDKRAARHHDCQPGRGCFEAGPKTS
jgi:hypothetical protein